MARWERAARLLWLPAGSRVLDLGCAFGWGTRLLVGTYATFGHDLQHAYVERARRSVPGARFTEGRADHVPYEDGFFDGVVLLDVLEHVPDAESVIAEVARLLRAGGEFVLTVPNKGLLTPLDSLNVYARLLPDAPPPTEDPSWPAVGEHRHYSAADIQHLLEPHFRIRHVGYTGLGIAEPINLLLLVLLRALWDAPRLYAALQYLYFGVYLAEDLLRTGPIGYHLTVVAERV